MSDDPTTMFQLPTKVEESAEAAALRTNDTSNRARIKRDFWQRISARKLAIDPMKSQIKPLVSADKIEELGRAPLAQSKPFKIPEDVREGIEERAPQFCLRNLYRYEKDAWVDDLWWQLLRVRPTPGELRVILDQVRHGQADLPPEPSLAGVEISAHRKAHRNLIQEEDWAHFDWRRGPKAENQKP